MRQAPAPNRECCKEFPHNGLYAVCGGINYILAKKRAANIKRALFSCAKIWYNGFMTAQQFIKKRPYLLWHVKDLDRVSNEAVVEAVLNYGDFDDVKKMINILGVHRAAKIFRKQIKQKRTNYDPKIPHYFELYFKKYA